MKTAANNWEQLKINNEIRSLYSSHIYIIGRPLIRHLIYDKKKISSLPLSNTTFRASISSENPDTRYSPSTQSPRLSISCTHLSMMNGRLVRWALTKVVKSIPNTPRICFKSGQQSLGTFSEHLLCALKPQSERHIHHRLVQY